MTWAHMTDGPYYGLVVKDMPVAVVFAHFAQSFKTRQLESFHLWHS